MGLFNGGLIGAILRNAEQNARRKELMDYMNDPRNQPTMWECRYCGMRHGAFSRPNPNYGRKCPNSPYGTHRWEEV